MDKKQFSEIYSKWGSSKLANIAIKKGWTKDLNEAQDLAQDVLTALLSINEPIQNIDAYLKSALQNKFIDMWKLRDHKIGDREIERGFDPNCVNETVRGYDNGIGFRESLDDNFLDNTFSKPLRALTKEEKDILFSHVHDEKSFNEIAREIGLSPSAVRKKYNNLIKKISH